MAIPTPDQIWADFNADGSVKEPAKQDIRRWSRFVQALAEAAGMKTYPNKTAMDADTIQDDGQPALLYADPVETNNYPTVWVWDDTENEWIDGVDRISAVHTQIDLLQDQIDVTNGSIDDIKAGLLQQPIRANFKARMGYAQTWRTISNPATRWTITETDGSYKIDTTGALPQVWPVGVKMPYDLVPGDTIEAEFKMTAGTIGQEGGPFFGTDTASSGDISTSAILYHWRNAAAGAGIYGQNYTGTGGIVSGYSTMPQAGTDAQPVPLVTDDVLRMKAQVLADRSLNLELFVNGVSKLKVLAPGVLPVGRVVVGIVTPPSASAIVMSVKRIGFIGSVVHIDADASVSGNGMFLTPVKSWDEAVAVALENQLSTLDVKILSPELRSAIVANDKTFSRYRIRGRGGSQTKVISADKNPNDWQLLAGTTKVYYRPNKNAAGQANTANSGAIYLTGVQMNPHPWYSLPDTILPYRGVSPAELETETGGGRRVSGGNLYVRIPDSIGAIPVATPMEVNISEASLYCVGAPQIECENVVFSRGGIHNMYLDRGFALFRHCGFEWAEINGTEDAAGNAYYEDCWWYAVGNDGGGRTFPASYDDVLTAPPVSIYINPKIRGTVVGDGISNHGASIAVRAKMIVINPDISDIGKDGIVPANCDFHISGGKVSRCANAQIEVIGGAGLPGESGMFAAGRVQDIELDPAGVGLYGFLSSNYAGGKASTELAGVHIGTPVNGELWGNVNAVSDRTSMPADFSTTYLNVTTERPNGSRVINANGVVTFMKKQAFDL
ncbi:hypothetical protein [Inquilinus sp. CA228]|uniref:hypothetical protein n=1 Tax=Inquilinus sp. CA228 TaxID=3455609 RepID=UPI003F8D32A6